MCAAETTQRADEVPPDGGDVLVNRRDRLAYRPADAAAALGISRSRLYELMAARKITGRKISLQVTVITRAELERYLDELPVADVAGSKDRVSPDPREQRSA